MGLSVSVHQKAAGTWLTTSIVSLIMEPDASQASLPV